MSPDSRSVYHEIDRSIRLQINQIYPELDLNWRNRLTQIMEGLPERVRLHIRAEILLPKGIRWDHKTNRFTRNHKPIKIESDDLPPKLQGYAKWCSSRIQDLKNLDDAMDIADLLENALEKLNNLDVSTEVGLSAGLHALRKNFVHAAAAVIKAKENLKLPKNLRNLDTAVVKSFINEVFLKQQMLDYWFRVLRSRQLAAMQHPFLSEYLAGEQKVRRLEVVQTSQYIFAIAASHVQGVNIFSIRRFLTEEKVLTYIYLNSAFIRTDRIDNPAHVQAFKRQIGSIVSLGERIDTMVINLVEKVENDYEQNVRSLLAAPLEAGNANIDLAIKKRLINYEDALKTSVLEPYKRGITKLAVHEDDFRYLLINLWQIFSEVTIDFKDFQMRPALLDNLVAERFMIRLLAYIRLVKKR